MNDAPGAERVRELSATLELLRERLREVEQLRERAARLAADIGDRGPHPAGDVSERQGALLVAVTLRGGTVDDADLAALARQLGVDAPEIDDLSARVEPLLQRRPSGGFRLTERGVEAAGTSRSALSPALLEAATRL